MKEEKQLLLKDLCSRLPYGVICKLSAKGANISITEKLETGGLGHFIFGTMDVIPYLRPMSSMTEEEAKEVCRLENFENRIICVIPNNHTYHFTVGDAVIDWLNAHHFDFRGLIEKGLALEAQADMYKTE